jgi:protein-tyrosine-phosphatase
MAAAIFNRMIAERGIDGVRADSFGIVPFYGDSDDVRHLRESAVRTVIGEVDGLKDHRPKGVGEIDFKDGDKLVLLDSGRFNELGAGILRNKSFKGRRVPMLVIETEDPFGGPVEDYIGCCLFLKGRIEENLDLMSRLVCSQTATGTGVGT